MYEPERSVSPEPVQIYGRLHHMKGKTKVIKQTCDMDCPQFTIGRSVLAFGEDHLCGVTDR